MKRLIPFSVAAALMMAACETKAPRQEVDEPIYIAPEDFSESPEVSGIITEVGDGEITLITEAGDTCTFLLALAEANHSVYGGYNQNDHVIVVPGTGDNAEELLNVSTLIGRWVYKNVAEEESGIHIKEGGMASSINLDTQTYLSWEMWGTRLLLTWRGDGGDGTSELVDSCDIRRLTPDTLVITSQFDPSLQIVYYRQAAN